MNRTPTGSLLPNQVIGGHYSILHKIAAGGMGAVYKAEDTHPQLGKRPIAIKEMILNSSMTQQEIDEAKKAFEREAVMLANLPPHQNLPRIYDYFEDANNWYLVMDFLQGETLEEYLQQQQGNRLKTEEVLDIGIQLCTVLDFLHSQKPQPIIFRDLKPANIMRAPDGHIYLIDFGIARLFKPGKAKDTVLFGSPGYAAPEQGGKAQTDARSDIYSLGATLHQLITGDDPSYHPFLFESFSFYTLQAPSELETLIFQMIELKMDKRPPSADVVKQELQKIQTILLQPAVQPQVAKPQQPVVPQEPAVPPNPLQPGMDICSFCNVQNPVGTAFCANCGGSMLGTPPQQQPNPNVQAQPVVPPAPINPPNLNQPQPHLPRRQLFPQLIKAGLTILLATGLELIRDKRELDSSDIEQLGENVGVGLPLGLGAIALIHLDQHNYSSSRRKFFAKAGEFVGAGALLIAGSSILTSATEATIGKLSSDPEWYLHPVETKIVDIKAEEKYTFFLPNNFIFSETYNNGNDSFTLRLTINNSSTDLDCEELSKHFYNYSEIVEYYAPNDSAINSWKKLVEQKEKEFKAMYPGQTLYIYVYESNHTDKNGNFNIIYSYSS